MCCLLNFSEGIYEKENVVIFIGNGQLVPLFSPQDVIVIAVCIFLVLDWYVFSILKLGSQSKDCWCFVNRID